MSRSTRLVPLRWQCGTAFRLDNDTKFHHRKSEIDLLQNGNNWKLFVTPLFVTAITQSLTSLTTGV